MPRFLLLPLLFSCCFANGQQANDTLFYIIYSPTFHTPAVLTIYKNNTVTKGSFRTLSVKNGQTIVDSFTTDLPNDLYEKYSDFFSSYHFPGYINNEKTDTSRNVERGLDGITLYGSYYPGAKRLFRFWSPRRDTRSRALFKMTLDDLSTYFRTKENRKYLKGLRRYSK